jgi:lysophospholipid acyltransferase (LPLAT)-like uncharacterized protein
MLLYKILGNLIFFVVWFFKLSYRFEEKVSSIAEAKKLPPYNAFFAALWHQDLVACLLSQKKHWGEFAALCSASKDGEMISIAMKRLGVIPVRGSSKKGGTKAKEQLIEIIKKGGVTIAITIDGPTGPIYEIKSGIIEMAQASGAPIVPYLARGKRNWVINSWDKMNIPKPFTKVYTYTGQPIWVPKDLPRERFHEIKDQIKNELFKAKEVLIESFKND